MPLTLTDATHLADAVRALEVEGHAAIVGISGYGGAGKTTVATALHDQLEGSVVLSGDGYLREQPPTSRSDEWSVMDRERLRRDARAAARTSGLSAVIVEGLGLFTPDLLETFDLTIWIDVDLDAATAQGMWRDEHVWRNPQVELWLEVWKPNDADFFARFRPDLVADVLFRP